LGRVGGLRTENREKEVRQSEERWTWDRKVKKRGTAVRREVDFGQKIEKKRYGSPKRGGLRTENREKAVRQSEERWTLDRKVKKSGKAVRREVDFGQESEKKR
jgi:hypothetical protein